MKRPILRQRAVGLILVLLSLAMLSCNREKVVAIKTMAGQLVGASSQIEQSLRAYWAAYHPPTGIMSEDEQYLNFAKSLVARHDELAAEGDKTAEEEKKTQFRKQMQFVLDAINQINQGTIPGLKQVRDIHKRAGAVNQSVAQLEEGSYFAGKAVEALEQHLLLIAGDLKDMHDLLEVSDQIVDETQLESGTFFDQAAARIFDRARRSKLPEEVMAKLIKDEIDKGFALRQSRLDARDQLLGRIGLTAGIAIEMAEKAKNYRKVQWSELMGYVRDLGALAGELELPEKYIADASEALAKVEKNWTKIEAIRKGLQIGEPNLSGATEDSNAVNE